MSDDTALTNELARLTAQHRLDRAEIDTALAEKESDRE